MFLFINYEDLRKSTIPSTDDAKQDMCDAGVLQRNVRYKLRESDGMSVFAVLVSVSRTCYKQGIFPRIAVEKIIKNPDWSIFKSPNNEKKADAVAVAAISS